MKAKKTSAHAKPAAAAEPGPGLVLPTLAGLPIDADGLNRLMKDLVTKAKTGTDPAQFTRLLIAGLTGDLHRK